MSDPTYPQVTVKLVGEDGNVFAVIGAVTKALKRAGVPADEVKAFSDSCFAAESYDQVLQIVLATVEVE